MSNMFLSIWIVIHVMRMNAYSYMPMSCAQLTVYDDLDVYESRVSKP